jgi:SAM-dependent methyltransferase
MEASVPSTRKNDYIIDIEDGAETARLFLQNELITQAMGGVFVRGVPREEIFHVLDLGCGPGGWALEVARKYPDMEIIGVDLSPTMCHYAAAMARVRGVSDNIMFECMDITGPLGFQDQAFDLVNGRFLVGFMRQATWPGLLAECRRVLRPGGVLCLTECEYTVSSSAALHRLQAALYEALRSEGHTFSVDGRSFGLVHHLGRLLTEAGFAAVQSVPWLLDASSGSALHLSASKDTEVAFALLKPYLLRVGVLSKEEFEQLYHQMVIDLRASGFTCLSFGATVWGVRSPV